MFEPIVWDGWWKPGIGDPIGLRWVAVAAYLVAAMGCFRAAWREPLPDGTRRTRPAAFWLVLAALMVVLGISKQLDLQNLAGRLGRGLIKSEGLYERRRTLQAGFILAIALACAVALATFLWAARRHLRRRWLALAGMLFILGFVVIRAASFHHVDAFLTAGLGGLKWNWIFELGGIGAVGLAAFRIALGRPPRRPPPPSRGRGGSCLRCENVH